ncbi:MAG: CBS domain-containing protein, partial [Halobacteria archaeon]|nr:CBS domain-containing protein [Halobacteria archaeon]
IFFVVLQFLPPFPSLIFVVSWLSIMNGILAVFNMLPAFPMDGGRILRSLLARSYPYAKATKLAADVGKLLAIAMGILGLLLALFVYIAASSESKMTVMSEALQGVKVSDLMTRDVKTVSPDATVQELTNRMLRERHTGYPVVENGDVVGIVTLSDAREDNEVERDAYEVEEVMTGDVITVAPDEDAFEVLKTLSQNNVGRLVVEEDSELVGIISRTDLMTALDVIQGGGSFRDTNIPRV